MVSAEGATTPETLRQKDRYVTEQGWKERARFNWVSVHRRS